MNHSSFDILITNGNVLDGTGSEATAVDIGIVGDQIEAVGDLSAAEARTRIDASGKTVCPGFIDAHSHGDAYILLEPSAPSKTYQGITTDVVGNCGASAAPVTGRQHLPSDWAEMEFPGKWTTVAEYRALLEQVKPAPNMVFLVGHNTLRRTVGAYEDRPLTAEEMSEMKHLLEQGMDDGARGLTTGLIYPPARFSPREEIVELAKVAARRGGIYTTHMRNEGGKVLEAIDEALDLGRATGIRVQISHLKAAGKDNWGLIDDALERIRTARAEGMPVAADRYPYTSSHTDLTVIFPDWALEGPKETRLARLKNPADRARLKEDLGADRSGRRWERITVGSTRHPDNKRFQGMPLVDIAGELGVEPVDAVLHFAETDRMMTSAFFAGMGEDNLVKVLAEPFVMIGSDASIRAPEGPLSHDYPHPRTYGTFPKVLRMALDGKTVTFQEAVRKMTSLPAEQFGLNDRGVLEKGKKADVLVINPETVRDTATYKNVHSLAEGIEKVIVNGVLTLNNGQLTGDRAGRFL